MVPLLEAVLAFVDAGGEAINIKAIVLLQGLLLQLKNGDLTVVFKTYCLKTTNTAVRKRGGETAAKMAVLMISKVFLQYLPLLEKDASFQEIWMETLSILDYSCSSQSDVLQEAAVEALKNMILVMAQEGVLRPDSPIWNVTWQRARACSSNLVPEMLKEYNINFD